jgi:hypothetical protein
MTKFFRGRIQNELNGGIQYNFGGFAPLIEDVVCPESVILQSTDILFPSAPQLNTGTYNRKYDFSGGTFFYAYYRENNLFYTTTAPDGFNYPVYQYPSANMFIIRCFSSLGIDIGWGFFSLNQDPFFFPAIGGNFLAYFFDYVEEGSIRYLKVGTQNNIPPITIPPQTIRSITIAYPSVCPSTTPTNTPTNTPTPSITRTPATTPSNTPSATPTKTPGTTPSNTPTKTPTPTITKTPTITPSKSGYANVYLAFDCSDPLTFRKFASNSTFVPGKVVKAQLTAGCWEIDSVSSGAWDDVITLSYNDCLSCPL